MKSLLSLILFIFSISSFAQTKLDLVKDNIDALNSSLLSSEVITSELSTKEILMSLKDNQEVDAYIHQSYLEKTYSLSSLSKYYFSEDAWYPKFCYDLIGENENLELCFIALKQIISTAGEKFGLLYLNGDQDASDFKTLYLVFSSKKGQKLIITLKIHEERD